MLVSLSPALLSSICAVSCLCIREQPVHVSNRLLHHHAEVPDKFSFLCGSKKELLCGSDLWLSDAPAAADCRCSHSAFSSTAHSTRPCINNVYMSSAWPWEHRPRSIRQDLCCRKGMNGQSTTLYKYGVDVWVLHGLCNNNGVVRVVGGCGHAPLDGILYGRG